MEARLDDIKSEFRLITAAGNGAAACKIAVGLCGSETGVQHGHACSQKHTTKSVSNNAGNYPVHSIPHVLRVRRASSRRWNLGTHSDGSGWAVSSGMLV